MIDCDELAEVTQKIFCNIIVLVFKGDVKRGLIGKIRTICGILEVDLVALLDGTSKLTLRHLILLQRFSLIPDNLICSLYELFEQMRLVIQA